MIKCWYRTELNGGGGLPAFFLHAVDTRSGVMAIIVKPGGDVSAVRLSSVTLDKSELPK